MQTLPTVNVDDPINTICATARLTDLGATVKRYPGYKEVREAYENADAALFDPLFIKLQRKLAAADQATQ